MHERVWAFASTKAFITNYSMHRCGNLPGFCCLRGFIQRQEAGIAIRVVPWQCMLYDNATCLLQVIGIATNDMGVGKDGARKESFTRGMALLGKQTLFAEVRSSWCT